MAITPMKDRVLIKRDEKETKSPGGIILTPQKEDPASGRIVAIGNGVSSEINVGDHVLFGKFCGTDVEDKGEKFVLMKESDIFGIFLN